MFDLDYCSDLKDKVKFVPSSDSNESVSVLYDIFLDKKPSLRWNKDNLISYLHDLWKDGENMDLYVVIPIINKLYQRGISGFGIEEGVEGIIHLISSII